MNNQSFQANENAFTQRLRRKRDKKTTVVSPGAKQQYPLRSPPTEIDVIENSSTPSPVILEKENSLYDFDFEPSVISSLNSNINRRIFEPDSMENNDIEKLHPTTKESDSSAPFKRNDFIHINQTSSSETISTHLNESELSKIDSNTPINEVMDTSATEEFKNVVDLDEEGFVPLIPVPINTDVKEQNHPSLTFVSDDFAENLANGVREPVHGLIIPCGWSWCRPGSIVHQTYTSLATSLAALDTTRELFHVYSPTELHITVATLSSFKASGSFLSTASSQERKAVMILWRDAFARALATKAPNMATFPLTVERVEVESSCCTFHFNDHSQSGSIRLLRECALDAAADVTLREFEVSHGLDSGALSRDLHIPEITHSTFIRFRKAIPNDVRYGLEALAATWKPVVVDITAVFMAYEYAPYMHVDRNKALIFVQSLINNRQITPSKSPRTPARSAQQIRTLVTPSPASALSTSNLTPVRGDVRDSSASANGIQGSTLAFDTPPPVTPVASGTAVTETSSALASPVTPNAIETTLISGISPISPDAVVQDIVSLSALLSTAATSAPLTPDTIETTSFAALTPPPLAPAAQARTTRAPQVNVQYEAPKKPSTAIWHRKRYTEVALAAAAVHVAAGLLWFVVSQRNKSK